MNQVAKDKWSIDLKGSKIVGLVAFEMIRISSPFLKIIKLLYLTQLSVTFQLIIITEMLKK